MVGNGATSLSCLLIMNIFYKQAHGHAVKVLAPFAVNLPAPGPLPLVMPLVKTIWINRSLRDQAVSSMNFMQARGIPCDPSRAGRRKWAKDSKRLKAAALRSLRSVGPVLEVEFNELVSHPAFFSHGV